MTQHKKDTCLAFQNTCQLQMIPMKLIHLFLIFTVGLLISGCTKITVHSQPDLLPHVQKRVAIFQLSPPTTMSPELWATIQDKVQKRFSQFSNFSSFLTNSELKDFLNNHPNLKQKQYQLATTLALTNITDKDISVPLSKDLKVDQYLLFHLDELTCSEQCDTNQQLWLRINLVDAKEGESIYRVRINYELDEDELEKKEYIVLDLTDELLNIFTEQFTVPWHQWRYEHLKRL